MHRSLGSIPKWVRGAPLPLSSVPRRSYSSRMARVAVRVAALGLVLGAAAPTWSGKSSPDHKRWLSYKTLRGSLRAGVANTSVSLAQWWQGSAGFRLQGKFELKQESHDPYFGRIEFKGRLEGSVNYRTGMKGITTEDLKSDTAAACNGAIGPESEVTFSINYKEGTYGFMVSAPVKCSMNKLTVKPSIGDSVDVDMGDEALFVVSPSADKLIKGFPLPDTGKDFKNSSATLVVPNIGMALPFNGFAEWSIGEDAEPEAEIKRIPGTWLPKAGANETTPGNSVEVRAVLHKKDKPGEPYIRKGRFKFELTGVSTEKGTCLNWPQQKDQTKDANQKFDLRIDPKRNPDFTVSANGQSAESKEALDNASINITAYDWGAWGKLKVTVTPEQEAPVTAHVEGNKTLREITIPVDEDGNHIADAWENANVIGAAKAADDDDMVPFGDSHPGDGFSTYEEYRGFMAQGKHISTKPFVKDIFIWDPGKIGIGYFAQTRLSIHLVNGKEFDILPGAINPRVINFNRGFGSSGDQHLLFLKNLNMPGLYGRAEGKGPGVPETCHTVKIDVARCLATNEQELKCTIAHELGHACNLFHHGQINYKVTSWQLLQPDGTWGPWLFGSTLSVAAQGGQESGVETCIMRYDGENLYENPAGNLRWRKKDLSIQRGESYFPVELAGSILCNSKKGTGVNAPAGFHGVSKAGDASKGECSKQLCVNDHKH